MQTTQDFIKQARQQLNLTQAQFSKMLGRWQSVVSRYESGDIEPPGSIILQVQNILLTHNFITKKHKKQQKS